MIGGKNGVAKNSKYEPGVLPPDREICESGKNYRLYRDGTLYVFGKDEISFTCHQVRAGERVPDYEFGKGVPVVRRIVIAHGVSALKTPYELRPGSYGNNIWEIPNTLTTPICLDVGSTVYYEKGFDLTLVLDYSILKNRNTWFEV